MAKFYKNSYFGSATQFAAVSDKPYPGRGSENQRANAVINYQHPKENPNFGSFASGQYDRDTGTPIRRYDGGGFNNTTAATKDRYGNEQGQLLNYTPGKITSAFSDPSMKVHVPTLLGLAGVESHRQTGGRELPMPDSSLSKQSSPMVQKVRKKLEAAGSGLPKNPDNPSSRVTNDIRFSSQAEHSSQRDEQTPMEAHDVMAGKQMIRSILRPPAPAAAGGPVSATDAYRGQKPEEGRPHQQSLFTGRQVANQQRKAGYAAPPKPAAANPTAADRDTAFHAQLSYHRDQANYADRIIATHPEHGVVASRNYNESRWGKYEGGNYTNPVAPKSMGTAMDNIAHHEFGFSPDRTGSVKTTSTTNRRGWTNTLTDGPSSEARQVEPRTARLLTGGAATPKPRIRKSKQLQFDLGM